MGVSTQLVGGWTGEENLDFVDSLRQSRKIKLIVTRHEQAAAMMAATVGRLTGASQYNNNNQIIIFLGHMNCQAQALTPHALGWV